MSINDYKYSNLSSAELEKIKMLENELNQDKTTSDQVIILAFQDRK